MRTSSRLRSLQVELPVAAALLLLLLAGAVTLLAHLEVRRQAQELAGVRLTQVAERLAAGTSSGRTLDRLREVAAQPALAALLLGGTDSAAARAVLAPGLLGGGTGAAALALWDVGERRVILGATRGDTTGWLGAPGIADTGSVSPISVISDSIVYYDMVVPVRSEGRLLGMLQRRSRVVESPQTRATIAALVGEDGTILIGAPGGTWTDLFRMTEAPASAVFSDTAVATYQRDGHLRLGTGRRVPGTPWVMVAELPVHAALAPTRGFLSRMGLIAAGLVVLTTIAAGILGRRITQPLRALADAADEIRRGRFDRRASLRGHPDIVEVGEAFNAMAEETDRHMRALAANEQRFRSLVTATAQIVWWTDAEGKVSDPLPGWQAFTGQSFDEARGSGWISAIHPDDADNTLRVWREAIEHRSLYEIEYRLRRHDGTYRWFASRAVPVLDHDGSIREWVGTGTDITRRRDAEENLHRKEEELAQAQRLDAIGRLAGGVAHDFNNLLTAIVVPAQLAADQLPAEHPVQSDLQEIRVAGERAADLTRQLLAFGRQQVMAPTVLTLNDVVEASGRMLKRVIPESVRLELALSKTAGKVRVDRSQLEQVIINLVVNARDAMPDGGQLTIETDTVDLTSRFCERHEGLTPGRYVMLAVTDTGTGMDEATRQQIFEPFFTTKPMGKGTGLGLSTVYGIVHQSGGRVWVYSELGKGTVVKVYFPVAEGEVAAVAPEVVVAPMSGSGTLLFAEDDPALRKIGVRVLERLGYRVLPAEHGDAALEIARTFDGPIDLLVTDMVMPGMSGVDLWEQLRLLRPEVPALFLSGWASDAVVRHRILEGDVPFVQKPFTAEQLGAKVREVLQRQMT